MASKEYYDLARELDEKFFVALCKNLNKEFCGLAYFEPKQIEEVLKKGLAFDYIAETNGFESVFGIKTSFAKERENLKQELELYKKALDVTLSHMEQDGIVCLFSGCPYREFDLDKQICISGDCPTKDGIKGFLLDEARKELNER